MDNKIKSDPIQLIVARFGHIQFFWNCFHLTYNPACFTVILVELKSGTNVWMRYNSLKLFPRNVIWVMVVCRVTVSTIKEKSCFWFCSGDVVEGVALPLYATITTQRWWNWWSLLYKHYTYYKMLVWSGLVSWFNGKSKVVGYLMPKQSL